MAKIHFIAALWVTAAVLYACLVFWAAPWVARSRLETALKEAGFDITFLPAPEHYYGTLVYNDIPLDKDRISSIRTVRVTFNPATFFFRRIFEKLEIKGISLTGEWENTLSLSGWNPPQEAPDLSSFHLIDVQDSRLSFLTPTAGGISVFFELQGQLARRKTEFQAHLRSTQKTFTFKTGITGVYSPSSWYAEAEIEDGKYETLSGNIKVSRLGGHINLSGAKNAPFKMLGEFRAGGLTLYGLPWQDFSGSVEAGTVIKFLSEARALGEEEIELTLNMVGKPGGPFRAGGSVHAVNAKKFAAFLKDQDAFSSLRKDLSRHGKAETDVEFLQEPATGPVALKYKLGEKTGAVTLP
ncbi:MAG: hypothetical protein IT558_00245 [Alphaproteobacteria bacterium]|nr:hypothetical protein [Alphaproteobacteria bacterium]